MFTLIFTVLCIVVSHNEAARILAVFPAPSISHQVVFRPIVQELAKRGHEVVVITPDPAFKKAEEPKNLKEIDVHDISYKIWRDKVMTISRGNADDLPTQMKFIMSIMVDVVDAQIKHKEVQSIIRDKNKKFDLLLIEACARPALIFSHIYKVPVIKISSMGAVMDNFEVLGAPDHPLIYPNLMHQKINNLTKWEKIQTVYNHYVMNNIFEQSKDLENIMIKDHLGKDAPSINDLSKNVHMLFLNANPIFEGIRPVPPTVVYIGGIHHKQEKKLPEDLRSFLHYSKNGVIYMSFGTNVDPSTLPLEKIQIFVKVLSQLPYNILWKWDQDELPGRTDNIKIFKWLPQSDLLRHPNIKLFITQGGLQSTDEAINAGVPLVGVPMLGDQWFNVEKYVYHKIGVRVGLESLTEDGFKIAVNTVLNDESYRRNIRSLRERMADEPMKPLERAVWWTEYVIRHEGATHLRSPAAQITWTQYLELELVFTLLAIALAVIAAFIVCLTLVCKCIKSRFCRITKNKRE